LKKWPNTRTSRGGYELWQIVVFNSGVKMNLKLSFIVLLILLVLFILVAVAAGVAILVVCLKRRKKTTDEQKKQGEKLTG